MTCDMNETIRDRARARARNEPDRNNVLHICTEAQALLPKANRVLSFADTIKILEFVLSINIKAHMFIKKVGRLSKLQQTDKFAATPPLMAVIVPPDNEVEVGRLKPI